MPIPESRDERTPSQRLVDEYVALCHAWDRLRDRPGGGLDKRFNKFLSLKGRGLGEAEMDAIGLRLEMNEGGNP